METTVRGSGCVAVALLLLLSGCGEATTSSAGTALGVAAAVAGGIAGVKLESSDSEVSGAYRRSAMRPIDHEAVALAGGPRGYWLGVCRKIDRVPGRPGLAGRALADGSCLLRDGSLGFGVTRLARLLVHEAQHVRDGIHSAFTESEVEQRARCADALFSASIELDGAGVRVAGDCDAWPDVVAMHKR